MSFKRTLMYFSFILSFGLIKHWWKKKSTTNNREIMLIVILYFMSEQNKSMKQLKDKTEAKHWAGSEK